MYKKAAQQKLRFMATQGQITTEDLFDLPLTQLDAIAQGVNKQIKDTEEESFIEAPSKGIRALKLKLDILKDVIAQRQADADAKDNKAVKDARIVKLQLALANKENADLLDMSTEDIEKELATLK